MTIPLWDAPGAWQHSAIAGIEDLRAAIWGANLSTLQLGASADLGSLAYAQANGVIYSSGSIHGKVGISGPLSEDSITVGVGLQLPPGSRQWLHEAPTGILAVFMPGDPHDALYAPGSLYAALTVPCARLEELAQDLEVDLDTRKIGGSGIHTGRFEPHAFRELQEIYANLHAESGSGPGADAGGRLLSAVIRHFGAGANMPPVRSRTGYGAIVSKARDYIDFELAHPLSVEMIARAAETSMRTLHRAFVTSLGETPYSYVLKLRLQRMRSAIISEADSRETIAAMGNRFGLTELGRAAHDYRSLYGELPSQTRATMLRVKR